MELPPPPPPPPPPTAAAVTLDELRDRMAGFVRAREWERFHTPRNILLALTGEVGELCELFQWRGEVPPGLPGWSDAERAALGDELADVLLYLTRLAHVCDVDLGRAALRKLEINAAKYPIERARGSASKYTSYVDAGELERIERAVDVSFSNAGAGGAGAGDAGSGVGASDVGSGAGADNAGAGTAGVGAWAHHAAGTQPASATAPRSSPLGLPLLLCAAAAAAGAAAATLCLGALVLLQHRRR